MGLNGQEIVLFKCLSWLGKGDPSCLSRGRKGAGMLEKMLGEVEREADSHCWELAQASGGYRILL